MEISLEGKVALVTGASRGIGKAVAATLAAAGADVMLSSRKIDALEATAAEIGTGGGKLEVFAANAGEPDQIRACVDATVERLGAVDILVNNAATNPYMGRPVDIDLPRFDKTWQVNYRGPVVWVQEAWRASMADRGGNVINMASIGGLSVETSIGHYNVTKAALIHLTRTFAADLAPTVRVNGIAPGLVKTDFARALWQPAEEAIASHTPLRRLGEPQDIANAALFLASDLSSWVTGQTIVVDGGALLGSFV
jgi:NAD(P)-dependent dehydrogenase (short-subunit alcohol dehydrogenase family)